MPRSLYLYGIFPAPGPQHLMLEGLDAQPVQTHTIQSFTFLYSEAQQERYLASRKNLLGHEKVLEAAMHKGYRTLLPLQFGLTISDWQRVMDELIIPHGDGLQRLFQRLAGYREVSVKVLWEQDTELERLMAEDDDLRAERDRLEGRQLSMDEVVRIGQAIERAMEARVEGIIAAFRTGLNPRALEVIENDPQMDSMIYNAAYLIPWDDEPGFATAIDALDGQFEGRLRIRYNNFTAPYNFARLEQLGAG